MKRKIKTYLIIAIIAIILVPITCSSIYIEGDTNNYDKDSMGTKYVDEDISEQSDNMLLNSELYNEETYQTMEIEPTNALLNEETAQTNYDQYLDSTIYNDVYRFDDDINLVEEVSGNVYLFGDNVTISSGYIYGNVFVVGNKISIENTVITGSVFIAGETINLNCIATDIYVAGNKVYLGELTEVYRDVRIAASKTNIQGYIAKNLYIVSDNILISDNAVVDGNLEYRSKEQENIPEGVIRGNVNFIKHENKSYTEINKTRVYIFDLICKIVSTLVISLFAILLTPKFIDIKEENTVNRFVVSLLIGIISLFFIPTLSVILLITIIGIPIATLLMLIYVLLLIIAFPITSIVITSYVVKRIKPESNSKLFFLGITVLVTAAMWMITKLPSIGFIMSSLFGLTGMGLIILKTFKKEKQSE